ncbi:hypothetical protein BFAG_04037 [Bacteroides fragilis 3_1_12]|uniref:Uncharacterized protein n=1 Tax=Bacteroides fragilis 3_1_12 TaxID=457424 RepID=A0ABN0BR36_BACFG|nr:hypothetical protein BFAG_04037 [Bacteroides fragilis 3_1_12]
MTCLFDTTSKNYWISSPKSFSSSYNSPILCIEFNEECGGIIQIIHLIYKEFIRKSLSLHVPK